MKTKNGKQVPFLELQRRAIALCKDLREVFERHGVRKLEAGGNEHWTSFYFDKNEREMPYSLQITFQKDSPFTPSPSICY